LGKLTFTVRIDRIDQLGDGNKLIIDYKTGAYLNANSWLGDRPDEPQLPLYAQLDDVSTAGIAFAQIAAGKHGYIGISQYDLCINGIKAAEEYRANDNKNWQALASDWKTILTQLGDDFFHGKARVDPKDAVQTCKRCSLKPLCRIQQQDRKIDDE
jgi:ATP-dependent helicase/nuclease subunit B